MRNGRNRSPKAYSKIEAEVSEIEKSSQHMKDKTDIQTSKSFDVVIIGGGAAGLSAALWCDDLGLSAVILEKESEFGGQLLWTFNEIKNYLGREAKNGLELRDAFVEQTANRAFSKRLSARTAKLNLKDKIVLLENGERLSARALIIATGVRRRILGVEGEKKFKDNGILTSGKRDKNSVREKKVAIIGGGDAALENALILSETASEVTIIHWRGDFRAHAEFVEKAKRNSKIKFSIRSIVKKFIGKKSIEALELEDLQTGETHLLSCDAVLIRIGVQPNTDFLSEELELDGNGYIKIDYLCRTNIEGVWAIGDVANPDSPTISSAAGMGATAVKNIYVWLNQQS